MASFSRLAVAAALVAATLSLSACFPLVVAGAAGTALLVTDRRSTGAQIDDASIEGKVAAFVVERLGDRAHVSVTSYNGLVLLTGEVPDEGARRDVEANARAAERVRSVQNELVVGPPSELSARTHDAYLTSLVKSRFLEATQKFSPTHVKVVTERGTVYLMGIVRRAEAEAAAQVAASTPGVVRVVKVFEYLD